MIDLGDFSVDVNSQTAIVALGKIAGLTLLKYPFRLKQSAF